MGNALVHVGVEVGDGLVARFGDALLLVVEPVQHRERAEDLLAAVEAAASNPVPPGQASPTDWLPSSPAASPGRSLPSARWPRWRRVTSSCYTARCRPR